MSRAAIEAIKKDLKDVQSQIRELQKDENKLERALALLTTTNPNVGTGKRTGKESKVVVRAAAKKPKAAKEPTPPKEEAPKPDPRVPPAPPKNGSVPPSVAKDRARSASMRKPRDQKERPEWGVATRGGVWFDAHGLTEIAREILRVLINAPGYRMGGADIRDEATIYISSADGTRWMRELAERGLLVRDGEVPPRGGHGRNSVAYKLTGSGLLVAQQVSRESETRREEIRLHAGVGVVR